MYIHILGPLVAAAITYILMGDIKYAYQAAFLFIVLQGLIRLTPAVIHLIRRKSSTESIDEKSKKKKNIEQVFTFSVLILIVIIFAISNMGYVGAHFSAYQLAKVSRSIPQKTLMTAINQLKQNPNNMLYCSPLFFPALKGNRSEAVVTYLAYYHLGQKYCDQYWWWGRNNCTYLEEYNYGSNPTLGLKNIKLCRIARSQRFINRVESGERK